jgi:hypothetical protein
MLIEVKLAITLRFLVGRQMFDIADNFGYCVSVCYYVMQRTLSIILQSSIREVQFFYSNVTWLKKKSLLFCGARSTNPLANGCIGALDGIAIQIQWLKKKDGVKQFSNRKGFFAIMCQAICDAQYRFLFFDCKSPGSTHDSVAFYRTSLFPYIQTSLPDSFWIVCDAAYPLIGSLMKLFDGKRRVDKWEDSFNFYLSSLRVIIEDVFGIFIHRWRIFWHTLRYDPKLATKIIVTCVQFHNFIINIDSTEKSLELIDCRNEHKFFTFFQNELVCALAISIGPLISKELRESLVKRLIDLQMVRLLVIHWNILL